MTLDDINPTVLAGLPASMRPAILEAAIRFGTSEDRLAELIADYIRPPLPRPRAVVRALRRRTTDDQARAIRPRGPDGEANFAGVRFSSGVTVSASATARNFRGPDDQARALRPRGLAALCGLASNPNAGHP